MNAQILPAENRVRTLKGDFEKLLREHEVLRSPEIYEQLAKVLPQLDAPVAVSFVGDFKTGKSSTLNAIVGQAVSPVNVTPTNALTCYFRYGDTLRARFIRLDGAVEETTREELYAVVDQNRQSAASAAKRKTLSHAEIFFPSEVLRDVVLVDTPGLNSQNRADDERALAHLAQADAVCWLFDANTGAVAAETLQRIERTLPHVRAAWAIVNRCDDKPPSERRQVVAGIQRAVGQRFRKVFAYSAAFAEQKRRGDRLDPEDVAGLDLMFIDEVVRAVRAESREIRAASAARVLAEAVETAWRGCDDARKKLDAEKSYITRTLLPTLEKGAEGMRAAHRAALTRLDDQLEGCINRFADGFTSPLQDRRPGQFADDKRPESARILLFQQIDRIGEQWLNDVENRVSGAKEHVQALLCRTPDEPAWFRRGVEDARYATVSALAMAQLVSPVDVLIGRIRSCANTMSYFMNREPFRICLTQDGGNKDVQDCLTKATDRWRDLRELTAFLTAPDTTHLTGYPYSLAAAAAEERLTELDAELESTDQLQRKLAQFVKAARALAEPSRR